VQSLLPNLSQLLGLTPVFVNDLTVLDISDISIVDIRGASQAITGKSTENRRRGDGRRDTVLRRGAERSGAEIHAFVGDMLQDAANKPRFLEEIVGPLDTIQHLIRRKSILDTPAQKAYLERFLR
jgi:hypothetical protein